MPPPRRYVGYEEGGVLTEAVRRRPWQVVLLDEFEKAHREVANLLLQVLDEGTLTDSQGRRVDFRNTIVVLTSNLGSDVLASMPTGEGASMDATREAVMERVRAAFPPEFVNRLDSCVVFNRLQRQHMNGIVDIQLRSLRELLAERRITLEIGNDAVDWLASCVTRGWAEGASPPPILALARPRRAPLRPAAPASTRSTEPGP